MGYSSLATVKVWSPNHSGRRTHTIDSVAIHCMAGNLSAKGCGDLFANTSRQASSNYGIGSDGTIGVYVDEDNRSWCTSSSGVDQRAVTIEVANTSTTEPFPVSDAAYESLIKLLVDICNRNNISGLRWKNDKAYAKAAEAGGPVTQQNMFVHRWFAEKSCPGEWLFNRQGQIATEVNRRLGNGETYSDGVTTGRTIIFVGDSRTVQMKAAVGENDNIWSCKGAMSFDWMKETGVPAIESKIGSNTAVCILMGINDMIYRQPSVYYNYINEKAVSWVAKGSTVYFVSVNPVRNSGYGSITNAKIEDFNQKIRNGLSSNVGYIDTYSVIKHTFNAPDGLHYDAETYKTIYNTIVAKAAGGNSDGGSFGLALNIDYTKFDPYLVTIDRNTDTAKAGWDSFKSAKVIGALVEAGYLFASYRMKKGTFENPKLSEQMKKLEEIELPFGLFTTCRAKTTVEAKEEMYQFSFPVRRYPPKLGVWLQLELNNSKEINNKVLDRYISDLTRLGFKSKMGIICKKSMLEKIDWDTYQNDFYLWVIDHVKSTDELDQLMDPEFFDMDGEG